MRIVRLVVFLLFVAILWVALETGAFRYHLTADQRPVRLEATERPQPDRLVELEGSPDVQHGIRSGRGPFRFALLPLRERRDVWLLFAGSAAGRVSAKMRVFRGRLVALRHIPFVRHLAGRRQGLSSQTLVVEVGHLPQRRWAWAFLTVLIVAVLSAQLLITFMVRVLRT